MSRNAIIRKTKHTQKYMHTESLPQWADAINGSELYIGVELELTENPCFLKNESKHKWFHLWPLCTTLSKRWPIQ